MDLQAEKIELVKLLLETESSEVINEIKAVFKRQGNDFYDDLPQHVKDSIEKGLKEIEQGEIYEHATVMQGIKTKYGLNS
jgi:predicted transcriptional regulator